MQQDKFLKIQSVNGYLAAVWYETTSILYYIFHDHIGLIALYISLSYWLYDIVYFIIILALGHCIFHYHIGFITLKHGIKLL